MPVSLHSEHNVYDFLKFPGLCFRYSIGAKGNALVPSYSVAGCLGNTPLHVSLSPLSRGVSGALDASYGGGSNTWQAC